MFNYVGGGLIYVRDAGALRDVRLLGWPMSGGLESFGCWWNNMDGVLNRKGTCGCYEILPWKRVAPNELRWVLKRHFCWGVGSDSEGSVRYPPTGNTKWMDSIDPIHSTRVSIEGYKKLGRDCKYYSYFEVWISRMQKMISSKKRTLGVLRSTQSWDCLLKTACLAAGIQCVVGSYLDMPLWKGSIALIELWMIFLHWKANHPHRRPYFNYLILQFSQISWLFRSFIPCATDETVAFQPHSRGCTSTGDKNSPEETFKERLQILSSSWAIANSDAWKMRLVLSLSYLSWWWPVG